MHFIKRILWHPLLRPLLGAGAGAAVALALYTTYQAGYSALAAMVPAPHEVINRSAAEQVGAKARTILMHLEDR